MSQYVKSMHAAQRDVLIQNWDLIARERYVVNQLEDQYIREATDYPLKQNSQRSTLDSNVAQTMFLTRFEQAAKEDGR